MIEANMDKIRLKGETVHILSEFTCIVGAIYRKMKIDKELIIRCAELGFLSDEEITQERIKTQKRFIENVLKDLFGANENE